MDVIRHEAIAVDGDSVHPGVPGEEGDVERIVGVPEEHLVSVVAALGEMVREVREGESVEARHLQI
jgi:hypothetical protein